MTIDDVLAHNREYVPIRPLSELPAQPRLRLAIVACMDARIDFVNALGLQPGDAHVIRNAGGRMADAVRSLVVSQATLGTREVAIVHHTKCGMLGFREDDLRATLRTERGVEASEINFHAFDDLEQSVRDDIELYRGHQVLLQDIPVRGFIYELETGHLQEVRA